jgi:hypothetical protein
MKILIVLLFTSQFCLSQNLVPNPGFESTNFLNCGWGGFYSPIDSAWSAVTDWSRPTQGSTDLHSTLVNSSCVNYHYLSTINCSPGKEWPHGGNNFAGIITHSTVDTPTSTYREYIQVQLTSPMVVGTKYYVEFYVSRGDHTRYATDLGVGFSTNVTQFLFSTTTYLGSPDISFPPVTSSTGWTLMSDSIVATQAFEYIIIGNFFDNASTNLVSVSPGVCLDLTAYYYIDDVSITPEEVVLPIELTSFDASCKDGRVELKWQTETEANNDFFTVEGSRDGVVFENLATISGAGNSLDPQYYSWVDENFYSETHYYRLFQTDFDGSKEEFQTISVNCTIENSHFLYPNPFDDKIILNSKYGGTITLVDSRGRVVLEEFVFAGENSILTNLVASGVYTAIVKLENGELNFHKIIKM